MTRRLLGILATMLLTLAAPVALACDCQFVPPAVAAQRSEIVAQVRIERIETAEAAGEIYYTMTPLKVWKGSFDSAFLVRTASDEASCGMPHLQVRSELLLIANRDPDGTPILTSCSGSEHYSDGIDQQVSAELGPGAEPSLDPRYPPGEVKVEGVEPNVMNIVIIGGTLLVLLGIVLGMLVASHVRQRR